LNVLYRDWLFPRRVRPDTLLDVVQVSNASPARALSSREPPGIKQPVR
jgi:hypothetical protein